MWLSRLIFISLLALSSPAFANGQMSADQCEPVSSAGLVVDIGMSCANSWLGQGQILRNTIRFDSAADTTNPQSSVGFVLGASVLSEAADPTPTGRAGHKGTYLSFDGGDYIIHAGRVGAAASVTDGGAKNWHKTTGGESFTIGFAFCYESNATFQTLFTTKATGNNQGITGYINAGGRVSVQQAGATAVTVTTDTDLVDGNCYAVGMAHETGTTNTRVWTTSTTAELLSHTFITATDVPTAPFTVGSSWNAALTTSSLRFESGTKLYDVLIDNTYYDDTAWGSWVTQIEARDGIDFTS